MGPWAGYLFQRCLGKDSLATQFTTHALPGSSVHRPSGQLSRITQPLSPVFSSIQSLSPDPHGLLHQLSIQPLSPAPNPHNQLPAPHAGRQSSSVSVPMHLCTWVPQFTQRLSRPIVHKTAAPTPHNLLSLTPLSMEPLSPAPGTLSP